MAEIQYKKDVKKKEVREIVEQINHFEYFLSLDPRAYFLGQYCYFSRKEIQQAVPFDDIPDSVYKLQWMRLFGEKVQLEWRQYGTGCHIVFFQKEVDKELAGFDSFSLQKKRESKEYLYGELDYHEFEKGNVIWYEGQIPRLLKYPVEENKLENVSENMSIRPYLETEEYMVEDENYDSDFIHYQNIGLREEDN